VEEVCEIFYRNIYSAKELYVIKFGLFSKKNYLTIFNKMPYEMNRKYREHHNNIKLNTKLEGVFIVIINNIAKLQTLQK
jgi:hypothetical protein